MNSTQSDVFNECIGSGELEQVLSGKTIRSETQPLLNSHLRCRTVFPNSKILFGVYNKSNYLSSCYNFCWIKNGEHGAQTHQLLCFGGGFSRCGSISATLMIFVFMLLPFAALWPFLTHVDKNDKWGLLVFTTCMEFILFLWHFYCIYIMKNKNCQVWVTSWFTFEVKKEILRNIEESHEILSLFDLDGKLRVIDVSVTDLCRMNSVLHQITVNERELLAIKIENLKLDQAAVILYSEEFTTEFVMHCLYGVFILASLSVSSFALLLWKTISL